MVIHGFHFSIGVNALESLFCDIGSVVQPILVGCLFYPPSDHPVGKQSHQDGGNILAVSFARSSGPRFPLIPRGQKHLSHFSLSWLWLVVLAFGKCDYVVYDCVRFSGTVVSFYDIV